MKIKLGDCKKWIEDNGDKTLRVEYKLNSESIVFDIGSARGEWAIDIVNLYNPQIILFEPTELAEKCKIIFKNYEKVKLFKSAAYIKDCKLIFKKDYGECDDPSVFSLNDSIEVNAIDFKNFLKQNRYGAVDLIKINIEGAEYELLEDLLNNDMIKIFKNLQIQFHLIDSKDCEKRYNQIASRLARTHKLTYKYPFVWENWEMVE